MIRIVRGPEPLALARARNRGLSAAVAAHTIGGPGSDAVAATLVGYAAAGVRKTLYLAQHKKCVWCERRRDESSSPVEHYRPKAGAWRHRRDERRKKIHAGHYWWLTWSWTNLYFACGRCNDQGHKGNFFRLEPKTRPRARPRRGVRDPLPAKFFDLSAERPLLLDPATDDPLDHIEWRPVDDRQPRRLWIWSPSGRTPRGKATIIDLKLEELADEVGSEIRTGVLRGIEEIERSLAAGQAAAAQARWVDLLADELSPESPLSAAKWCALRLCMPAAEQARHGFATLVRPG